MPYGTVKVDNITFTNNGVDTTITVSGLAESTTGNLTVTGTISGSTANFVSGSFSTRVSGLTVAGTTGTFTSLTGTTTQGTTATFTTGSFTSLTGTTTTGTTANFVSGVFTTQVSGATITGTTVAATTGTFTTVTGGVITITSGVFALGSAAAPSISFSGDADNGIYSPGANQVAISTSGTGRLFVTSAGLVGIGTSAPSVLLHSVVSSAGVAYRGGHNNTGFDVYVDDSTGEARLVAKRAGGSGGKFMSFYTDTGSGEFERVRIDSSGRLLVGTSTARANFYNGTDTGIFQVEGANDITKRFSSFIYGRDSSDGPLLLLGKHRGNSAGGTAAVASGDEIGRITFQGSDGTHFVAGAEIYGYVDNTPGADDMPGRLVFATTADGASSPTERLRITSAGLVGIGTSAPGVTLDVSGIARVASGNDAGSLLFKHTTASANSRSWRAINDVTAYGDFAIQQSTTQTGGTYASRLYINASGNVGIGTSAPGDKLSVYTASATDTVIGIGNTAGNGWAGYLTSGGDLLYGLQTSGNVTLRTNNQERLRITSAGLVGIGTSAPSQLLHLSAANNPQIRLTDQFTANTNGYIQHANGTLIIDTQYNSGDGILKFTRNNGASESARFDTSGRLLVGTSSIVVGSPQTIIEKSSSDLDILRVQCGAESASNLAGIAFGFAANGARPKTAIASVAAGSFGRGSLAFYVDQAFDNNSVSSSDEVARFDTSGRLLVGTSTARSNFLAGGASALVQIERAGEGTAEFSAVRNANSTSGGLLILGKSRSAAVGGVTTIANNDQMGWISFQGADGTNLVEGASIRGEVDGTPGANDMPGRLVFSTTADGASSPTERMRISNTGVINTFNASGDSLNVRSGVAAGTSSGLIYGLHSATGTGNGTTSFIVWTNGNVVNTNNSYGAISDIKLKENIVDATSQWDDIKALQVRKYSFKEGQTHTQIGLIAQEVELVSPGLVSESPDRDAEGNDLGTVTKSVNYSVLYMKAVKALQEAMERIETLEAKVTALEGA